MLGPEGIDRVYRAELDPEDARSLLDPILERMMDAVGRYEGTINQVMGDGIQALFGAPIAYEDRAVRACFAALKMQELIRKYAEGGAPDQGVPLLVRVGLNSGEVVVRSMGSELHMNYSAHGQAVHLAARMEQMAVPGTILMSSQTLHLAQGYVMTRSLGPMLVKGLNAPVLSYELLGAVAVSRLAALARHGLTRFVGRGEEIEKLRHALDLAYARHGQIVALVGEPGVGASFVSSTSSPARLPDSWHVLEAGALSCTARPPATCRLRNSSEAISSSPRPTISQNHSPREGHRKLMRLDEAPLAGLPALLLLLDPSPDDGTRSRPRTGRSAGSKITKPSNGCRCSARAGKYGRSCSFFEDLHSIDQETMALIDGHS